MQPLNQQNEASYTFNDFELDPVRRVLLRAGKAVALKPKVFETLLVLVRNSGRVLGKDELMQRVWPDTVVEEVNLAHNISVLRKALGQRSDENRFIITVPGKGYGFVADVARTQREPIPATISEYELTRSRVVVEEVTDDLEIPETPLTYSGLSDARLAATPEKLLHETPARRTRRRSSTLLLAASLIVALALAGFLFWRNYQREANNGSSSILFAEGHIKQLTTTGMVRWAFLSRDGRFYAYTLTDRDGGKESLWLGQTDGSNEIQLRPPDDVVYNGLAFSPDGKMLHFTVNSGAQSKKGFFRIPVLGGVPERLPLDIHSHFALSPDGRQVTFFRSSGQENGSALVIADIDGTGLRELVALPPERPFGTRAEWSPDGSSIAFSAVNDSVKESRELFVVRVADARVDQLTSLDWIRVANLVWLPDGRGLIIVAIDKSEAVRQLWQVDYPGGNARRFSRDTDGYGTALSISADGNLLAAVQVRRESNIWMAPANDLSRAKQVTFSSINGLYAYYGFDWTPDNRIVFSAGVNRTLAIHSMDANGAQIRQLTSAGFDDQAPNVSADGEFIVFQSNRSGSNEIWRARLDGGDLRLLTAGGGNFGPNIAPDGKWVIYTSTRRGKSLVSRVNVDGGDPAPVTNVESSNPRFSPDGRLIACGYRAEGGSGEQLALLKSEDGSPLKLFDVPSSAAFNNGIRWTPDGKALCYRDRVNGIWRQPIEGGRHTGWPGFPKSRASRTDGPATDECSRSPAAGPWLTWWSSAKRNSLLSLSRCARKR
jgi:Tol biopolymer transport system component/DNA-binding winged helix-turn-helix (wHTH) protein